jgi:hypothetical protein
MGAKGTAEMHDSVTHSNVEQSTVQLIVDQLEELVVTIIEEIRERPGVAAAILAAVVGAVIGSALALNAGGRHASPAKRVARSTRGMAEMAELAGLAVKLLQNPLVRHYVRSALESQLKKRIPH